MVSADAQKRQASARDLEHARSSGGAHRRKLVALCCPRVGQQLFEHSKHVTCQPRCHLSFSALFGNPSVKYAEAGAGPWVQKKGSADRCLWSVAVKHMRRRPEMLLVF